MGSLHEVIEKTKKTLKIFGLLIISSIILYFIYRGIIFAKDYFFPKPEIPPNTIFGKLPPIKFPNSNSSTSHTYKIDTITGFLPVFYDKNKAVINKISVPKIIKEDLTLLDLQKTLLRVNRVGFFDRGIKINETQYQFGNNDLLPKTMLIDIVSNNFTLTSDYLSDQRIASSSVNFSEIEAVELAKKYISSLELLHSDLDPIKTRAQLLKKDGNELMPAEDLDDTQYIRVNFYHKDIDNIKIYYPRHPESIMYLVVAQLQKRSPEVVFGEYYHYSIETNKSTYPLKDINLAYKELSDGKAYVSSDFSDEKEIKIKEVFLGYYLDKNDPEYLMPIYIFKGKDDQFVAYVSAIQNEWIK